MEAGRQADEEWLATGTYIPNRLKRQPADRAAQFVYTTYIGGRLTATAAIAGSSQTAFDRVVISP